MVSGFQESLDSLVDDVASHTAGPLQAVLENLYGSNATLPVSRALSRAGSPLPAPHRRVSGGKDDEDTDLGSKGTGLSLGAQPTALRDITLNGYQLDGLRWLTALYDAGLGGILGDEMGLGKTIQSISLLAWLREARGVRGPHLILAPTSTLNDTGGWPNELRRWSGCRVTLLLGDQTTRTEQLHRAFGPASEVRAGRARVQCDVLLTSYEIAAREINLLSKVKWHALVVDEAHRLKNSDTQLYKLLHKIPFKFRLLLTGTPLMNHLRELGALLAFAAPSIFESRRDLFGSFISNALGGETEGEAETEAGAGAGAGGDLDVETALAPAPAPAAEGDGGAEALATLNTAIRPFLLRRTKAELTLPPKTEIAIHCPLSDTQYRVYRSILQDSAAGFSTAGSALPNVRIVNTVMQLRKCCAHPYLIDGVEPEPLEDGEHLVRASGKLAVLDKLLSRVFRENGRALIFSPFSRTLDILEDYFDYRGIPSLRLDGSASLEDRGRAVRLFNAPNSKYPVFMLTTRAGGLGLNLATADTVVLYDSDWNPFLDLQAQDRAHRIGQTRPVTVYRLITQGTLELMIWKRQLLKLELDRVVLRSSSASAVRLQAQQKAAGPRAEELLLAMQQGAQEIVLSNGAEGAEGADAGVTDAELDAIIETSRQAQAKVTANVQTLGARVSSKLNGGGDEAAAAAVLERVSVADLVALEDGTQATEGYREFAGVDYAAKEAAGALAEIGALVNHRDQYQTAAEAAREARQKLVDSLVPKRERLMPPLRPTWQLYPPELYVLQTRCEHLADARVSETRAVLAAAAVRAGIANPLSDRFEHPPIDTTPLLPPADEERRAELFSAPTGFPAWGCRDFQGFVRAVAAHGRDIPTVARAIGWAPGDVETYDAAFFDEQRGYMQLVSREEAQRVQKIIDDGSRARTRMRDATNALDERLRIAELGFTALAARTTPKPAMAARPSGAPGNATLLGAGRAAAARARAAFTLPRDGRGPDWGPAADRALLLAASGGDFRNLSRARSDPSCALSWVLRSRVAMHRRDETQVRVERMLALLHKECNK